MSRLIFPFEFTSLLDSNGYLGVLQLLISGNRERLFAHSDANDLSFDGCRGIGAVALGKVLEA